MSIASFFEGLLGDAKKVETVVTETVSDASNFVGTVLGMAAVVTDIADPALAPAVAALQATVAAINAAVSGTESAVNNAITATSVSAQQIATVTAQAVHVAVLAAPSLKVVANQAATAATA